MRRLSGVLLCATWACAVAGCNDSEKPSGSETSKLEGKAELGPSFNLTKDSKNVLYTWVDQDGTFRITERAEDVPEASRHPVRVVIEGKTPGTADEIFIADLRKMGEKFPISVLPRSKWEALGQAARNKKVAELRPPEVDSGPTPTDLGVDAIVYGADWCKPCHLAEDYLKRKGARVLKKDIEEDATAAREMQQKLESANMKGSSIPVLDVGGTILRGFSTSAIDRALAAAQPKRAGK